MTTNKEALQKIFEAALKEPETQYTSATKTRPRTPVESYPRTRSYGEPAATATTQRVIEPVRREVINPDSPTKRAIQVETAKTAIPTSTAATQHASPEEAVSAPEQNKSKGKGRRKMQLLVMIIAVVGGIGGIAWFLQ